VADLNRTEIKSFWEKASTGSDGSFGSHSDPNVEGLENWFVLKYGLGRTRPRALLDVGCGKGERTRFLSSFVREMTLGIDYSPGMIRLAKRKETEKLRFQTADILQRPRLDVRPDIIVSCRFLINLGTEKNVLLALDFLGTLLGKGGRLVFLEASVQGHNRLNKLRRELGLPDIKTAWYNINLDERRIEGRLNKKFELVSKTRFGLYYLLTRGIYPGSIRPAEPDPRSRLNHVARQLQIEAGVGTLEQFGRHYCAVFRKR